MPADKTQENVSQSLAVKNVQVQSSGESTLHFSDNRPDNATQRKLQEIANDSPQVHQLKAFQESAANRSHAKETAQLQSTANNSKYLKQQIIQRKENKTGLPDNLKTGMENLSGISLDGVKVHRNSEKPARLKAHAYAQGTDIHLGPGQEKHLPHEAWHVVQQMQGRVQATMQTKGKVNINDNADLEKEADIMGVRALQCSEEEHKKLSNISSSNPLQRKVLQRAVDTAGGTWDTTKYEAWGPKRPDYFSPLGVGAEIALNFMPGKGSPFGSKIGLIQTVTATKDGVPDPTGMEAVALNNSGTAIDRIEGSTSPVYGVDNTPLKKAQKLNDNLNKEGENTYGVRNLIGNNQAAKLWDMPSSDVSEKALILKTFETAAVVLEGKNKGTYLGSVSWGYESPSGKKEPELKPTTLTMSSFGTPTQEFQNAAEEWNDAKGPEDDNLVKVPVQRAFDSGATFHRHDKVGLFADPVIHGTSDLKAHFQYPSSFGSVIQRVTEKGKVTPSSVGLEKTKNYAGSVKNGKQKQALEFRTKLIAKGKERFNELNSGKSTAEEAELRPIKELSEQEVNETSHGRIIHDAKKGKKGKKTEWHVFTDIIRKTPLDSEERIGEYQTVFEVSKTNRIQSVHTINSYQGRTDPEKPKETVEKIPGKDGAPDIVLSQAEVVNMQITYLRKNLPKLGIFKTDNRGELEYPFKIQRGPATGTPLAIALSGDPVPEEDVKYLIYGSEHATLAHIFARKHNHQEGDISITLEDNAPTFEFTQSNNI